MNEPPAPLPSGSMAVPAGPGKSGGWPHAPLLWAPGVSLALSGLLLAGDRAGFYSGQMLFWLQALLAFLLVAGLAGWSFHTLRTSNFRLLREEAASHRLAAIVVDAAPVAMLMADKTRKIVLVNRKAEELFGYTREEMEGQDVEFLIPERIREHHPAYVAAFMNNPQSRAMGAGRDLFGLHKSGSEIPVEIGLNYLVTPEGLFAVASIVDITARQRAQDELRRSNADLEQFAYVASHDLQEPLRMVASYTELLGQRYQGRLDEKADKYIHYAVDGAKRMQRLVSDLLAFSRVGSQGKKLVPVDATMVLQRVQETLRRPIREAGATVELGPLPAVMADETQLHQLFQNLIGNALKFRSDRPPRIVVTATAQHQRWVFAVADNGIGIEMQYADRIFQMFQRLHSLGKYEGSGIGLAIAKRIVERHGGTIWLESVPGSGTTFFLTLPKARPEAETLAKGDPSP